MGAAFEPNFILISLLDAFNRVGLAKFAEVWAGTEAAAIRLGKRSIVDPEARKRAQNVLRTMMVWAENGDLMLVYTDFQDRRVSYGRAPSRWLSALFPDPSSTGDGLIELGNEETYPCLVNERTLLKLLRHFPVRRAKPGPKSKFSEFERLCDEAIRCLPPKPTNPDIVRFIGVHGLDKAKWPKKTRLNEIIEEARVRAKRPQSLIPD